MLLVLFRAFSPLPACLVGTRTDRVHRRQKGVFELMARYYLPGVGMDQHTEDIKAGLMIRQLMITNIGVCGCHHVVLLGLIHVFLGLDISKGGCTGFDLSKDDWPSNSFSLFIKILSKLINLSKSGS